MNKPLRHKTSRKPAEHTALRIYNYRLNPQIPHSMLTTTQREILSFALKFHEAYQIFPTTRQICEGEINGSLAIDKKRNSPSNVSEILNRLVECGHLGRCIKSDRTQYLTVEETEMAIENQNRFKSKHGKSSL